MITNALTWRFPTMPKKLSYFQVSGHQLGGEFYYDCEVSRLEDAVVGSYVVEMASADFLSSHPGGEY